ncbi:MAG TPA: GAP family protein [Methylococcus sp.]|nr:GAP family protein [Methylococcus sp.]
MLALLVAIVAIAALDSINPTATAVHLYLLSTASPVPRTMAFILGIFTANYLGGFFGVVGLDVLFQYLPGASFGPIGRVARLILGIGLVAAGWIMASDRKGRARKPKSLRPLHTFILGTVITLAELPTALPYLAAIAIIAQARLDLAQTIGLLLIYNVVFVTPLIALLMIYLLLRRNRPAFLQRTRRWIARWSPRLLRMVLVFLGVVLIADSLADPFGRSFFPMPCKRMNAD